MKEKVSDLMHLSWIKPSQVEEIDPPTNNSLKANYDPAPNAPLKQGALHALPLQSNLNPDSMSLQPQKAIKSADKCSPKWHR